MMIVHVEKLLREVDKFSGEKNEDAGRVFGNSRRKGTFEGRLSDFEILGAVSTVLKSEARRWWRTSRDRITTWAEFKAQLRRLYVRDFDEEDLWSDLRHRTRAEKEKISP